MTAPLLAGIVLLAVGAVAIWGPRIPPGQRLAAVVLAGAVGLAALRMFALALPVALFGLGLWRRGAPLAQPGAAGVAEVESDGLAMSLDRETGEIDGVVLGGRFAGARLSALAPADLRTLARGFEDEGEAESLALLLAYLERRGIAREEPAGPAGAAAPGPGGPMTETEALAVLGLAPGAGREEVRAAYRRLIRRVHPDHGGSSPLAALLNRAREVLDPDA